jgi:hypothetical protein
VAFLGAVFLWLWVVVSDVSEESAVSFLRTVAL